jgi:hypothetical protein
VSDHLIAEANRHAKALDKMTLPTTKPNQRDLDWYIAECIDLRRQLEYEVEAKRNHLRIACEEINHLTVKTGFYEREIARLRADQIRVDWIAQAPDKRLSAVHNIWVNDGDIADVRAAIDAARKEAQL